MRRWLLASLALLLLSPAGALAHGATPPKIRACVGPSGHVRLAHGACQRWERPLSWQRGGGVWLHDAEGRPLGRLIANAVGFWAWVERGGLRVRLDPISGTVRSPESIVSFDEPDCRGNGFGGFAPGNLIATSQTSPLFLVTERVLENVTRHSRRIADVCQNLSPTTFARSLEVVPFTGDLPFELPVRVPLGFGTGPLGEVREELIDACAGPHGFLRIPGAAICRGHERPLRWQRLGGLRVYDGLGRDLGAAVSPNVVGVMGILLSEGGAWIEPQPLDGALPRARTLFTEPGCQGDAFVAFTSQSARPSGLVSAGDAPGRFVISIPEIVEALAYRSVRDTAGRCTDGSATTDAQRLVSYTGPLPELPIPTPIVVGFPGSPIANPDGPAVEAGVQHACAGPWGFLRATEEGEACGRVERALRWPRRGGLRALDGTGNDLGAFLSHPWSPSVGDTLELIDDASGLRFGVRFHGGGIGDPITRGVVPVAASFTGTSCTGTPFRLAEAAVGLVFELRANRLWVGTGMEPLIELSQSVNFSCVETGFIDVPLPSTVVRPFSGVVPFPLPVATPLLVGPGN